jgi:hypothetical protein
VGASTSQNPTGLHGLLRGQLYFRSSTTQRRCVSKVRSLGTFMKNIKRKEIFKELIKIIGKDARK